MSRGSSRQYGPRIFFGRIVYGKLGSGKDKSVRRMALQAIDTVKNSIAINNDQRREAVKIVEQVSHIKLGMIE